MTQWQHCAACITISVMFSAVCTGIVQRCGREIFRLLALEGGDLRAQNPEYDAHGMKADEVNDTPDESKKVPGRTTTSRSDPLGLRTGFGLAKPLQFAGMCRNRFILMCFWYFCEDFL